MVELVETGCSTSTTRSNSSPFAVSGVSDLTRSVATKVGSPITQAMPSPSHSASTRSRSAWTPWITGNPELRIDTGTFASGSTARITGAASSMISDGVR